MQNAAKYNGYNKNEYNKTVLLWHLLQALFISFYLLIIIMFARLLGKKKDPKAVKTKEELRTEMILNTTININNKIKLAEDKYTVFTAYHCRATRLGIKRALLMKQARAIKNNRDNGSKIRVLLFL